MKSEPTNNNIIKPTMMLTKVTIYSNHVRRAFIRKAGNLRNFLLKYNEQLKRLLNQIEIPADLNNLRINLPIQ
jgi:hypothetical protein